MEKGYRGYMSKLNKKNKKSKKNNRKNYKIESLEPRLLMDGDQWGNEIQSSVYYAVGSASLGVAA